MTCEACVGMGWIVANVNSVGHLRIKRCDACGSYSTDREAEQAALATIAQRMDERRKAILSTVPDWP